VQSANESQRDTETLRTWASIRWGHLVCEENYLSVGNKCYHLQCFIRMNLILLTFKVLLFFHEHPVFTSYHSATSHKIVNNQQYLGKIKYLLEFSLFKEPLSRISYWLFRESPIDNTDVRVDKSVLYFPQSDSSVSW
jgi:hypothetical protein